jgi:hypothetical protein
MMASRSKIILTRTGPGNYGWLFVYVDKSIIIHTVAIMARAAIMALT